GCRVRGWGCVVGRAGLSCACSVQAGWRPMENVGRPTRGSGVLGPGAELFPHLRGEGLAVGVAGPGIALETVQAFSQVEDGPLGGAVQVVQFIPRPPAPARDWPSRAGAGRV